MSRIGQRLPIQRLVEDQPLFTTEQLCVAGDNDTPCGAVFAGTAADDLRQGIKWGETHERMFHSMLMPGQTRLAYTPGRKVCRTQAGDPVTLYLQKLPSGTAPTREDLVLDDGTAYAAVIESGRQRRRSAMVINDRLAWLARTFAAPVREQKGKRVKFRNAILEWVASESQHMPEAAWLRGEQGEALVREIVGENDRDGWFDEDLFPYPFLLTCSVFAVDADLSDMELLGKSMARNEGKVHTPFSIQSMQIAKLRRVQVKGQPLSYTQIARLLGWGEEGADSVRDKELVQHLIPEVQAALDSGLLTLNVAIKGQGGGKRNQAFINHPQGGDRVPLTPDQQSYVWQRLQEEFRGEDGTIEPIRGGKAFSVALKAKTEALTGKRVTDSQLDELEKDHRQRPNLPEKAEKPEKKAVYAPEGDEEKETAEEGAEAQTQDAVHQDGAEPSPVAQVAQTTQTPAPVQSQAKSAPINPAAMPEWSPQRIAGWAARMEEVSPHLPDPNENGLRQAEIERRSMALLEAQIGGALLRFLSGDKSALEAYPTLGATLAPDEGYVREVLVALVSAWDGEEEMPSLGNKLIQGRQPEGAELAAAKGQLLKLMAKVPAGAPEERQLALIEILG